MDSTATHRSRWVLRPDIIASLRGSVQRACVNVQESVPTPLQAGEHHVEPGCSVGPHDENCRAQQLPCWQQQWQQTAWEDDSVTEKGTNGNPRGNTCKEGGPVRAVYSLGPWWPVPFALFRGGKDTSPFSSVWAAWPFNHWGMVPDGAVVLTAPRAATQEFHTQEGKTVEGASRSDTPAHSDIQ